MTTREPGPREGRTLDRRQWIAGVFSLPVVSALEGCIEGVGEQRSTGSRADETMAERVTQTIREYDAQGIHRTGTAGDQECARWLVDKVRQMGVAVELEGMVFDRIDSETCFVEFADQRIEGVPLFDGPLSGEDGVSGRLGAADDPDAGIGLIEIPPGSAGRSDFHAYRRETSHGGIVAVTGGQRWNVPAGLALCNAESYREPYGPPAIQVGSGALPALNGASDRGATVRLVNYGSRTTTEVFNTVARVEGSRAFSRIAVELTKRPASTSQGERHV